MYEVCCIQEILECRFAAIEVVAELTQTLKIRNKQNN